MKNNINIGVLREKEELEKKLSKEISLNFSISEKLARKFIYETHLSLEDFRKQVQKEQKENNDLKEKLTNQRIEKLYFAILGAKKLIEQSSQEDLEDLKKILDKKDFDIGETTKIIEKLFNKRLISRAKNPKNFSEHIMGASLGMFNSTVIIGELLYSLGIGILRTPTDLYLILLGKGKLDSLKRV